MSLFTQVELSETLTGSLSVVGAYTTEGTDTWRWGISQILLDIGLAFLVSILPLGLIAAILIIGKSRIHKNEGAQSLGFNKILFTNLGLGILVFSLLLLLVPIYRNPSVAFDWTDFVKTLWSIELAPYSSEYFSEFEKTGPTTSIRFDRYPDSDTFPSLAGGRYFYVPPFNNPNEFSEAVAGKLMSLLSIPFFLLGFILLIRGMSLSPSRLIEKQQNLLDDHIQIDQKNELQNLLKSELDELKSLLKSELEGILNNQNLNDLGGKDAERYMKTYRVYENVRTALSLLSLGTALNMQRTAWESNSLHAILNELFGRRVNIEEQREQDREKSKHHVFFEGTLQKTESGEFYLSIENVGEGTARDLSICSNGEDITSYEGVETKDYPNTVQAGERFGFSLGSDPDRIGPINLEFTWQNELGEHMSSHTTIDPS